MRKFILAILVLVLAAFLVACNDNGSVSNENEDDYIAETLTTTTTTESPTTTTTQPTIPHNELPNTTAATDAPQAQEITTTVPPIQHIPTASGFTVIVGNNEYEVSMSEYIGLNPQPVVAYPRNERRDFAGVSLANVLRHVGVDLSQVSSVVVWSADGFGASIDIADIINEEQAFLVFEEVREGQPTRLSDRDGYWQQAPFMLVLAQDPFANRFARYVTEIVVQ